MAEPIFSDATERFWRTLPEHYRTVDAGLDWPFKRYLSCPLDELGDVHDLIDRIDWRLVEDGGDPDDTPELADLAWLPWLAQAVGVTLTPDMDEADQRANVAGASTGWRSGTRAGIAAAAATTLTGTKSVDVIPNYGGAWTIAVRTLPIETADPAATLAAIIDAHAKPALFDLVHISYAADWDTIEAELPTWDDIEAAGSWDAIESTV
jgi:hypothetical protein